MSGYVAAGVCSAAPLNEDVCDCCKHSESDSDNPTFPTGDDCCDCICEGAILAAHQSLGDLGIGAHLSGYGFDLVAVTGRPLCCLAHVWDSAASTVRPARAVRLAMHSLQI